MSESESERLLMWNPILLRQKVTALQRELDIAKARIEAAPHEDNCKGMATGHPVLCNCWKSKEIES